MPLNVLHISTYDNQQGAAKAAWRLHQAMRSIGIESTMVVAAKATQDTSVLVAPLQPVFKKVARRLFHRLRREPGRATTGVGWYDFDDSGDRYIKLPDVAKSDILVIHLTRNFITAKDIASLVRNLGVPVVYIPVDMAPMTGGCHHHFDCEGYKYSCGNCPQLLDKGDCDLSRRGWEKKRKYIAPLDITFVAPTSWIHKRLAESSLYSRNRCVDIPLSIDTQIYRPADKAVARLKLNVPDIAKLVFCGAHSLSDPRKGFLYLVEALKLLATETSLQGMVSSVVVLTAGLSNAPELADLPFEVIPLGYVDETTLADAYRAADVFVCPSVYDAGPMMIPEAMMCGTPVVAFDSGGAPDLIRSGINGYLAKYRDSADLARGISEVLFAEDHESMSRAALEDAEARHSPRLVARQYQRLFEELKLGRR